jgi:hypothetical protein
MTYHNIVVPSRNRPKNIRELYQSFEYTCTLDTKLVIAIDDDDADLDEYLADAGASNYHSVEIVVGPRLRIGPTLNSLVPEFADRAFAVGFMGDDHRPRTLGWDEAYVHALGELGTGIVYGNDLLQGENIPTQVAMTSDIVKATRKFVPDGMKHLYLDDAWKTLGNALGCLKYLPEVVVEHLHPTVGKAAWDESYRENNSDATYSADREAYERWVREDLQTWVTKIREYREETT